MKQAFAFVCAALLLTACGGGGSSKIQEWEYKTVMADLSYHGGDWGNSDFMLSDDTLAVLGEEGWELVTSYEMVHTVFPNFGASAYVTGIRTNTRTFQVRFIFKRPLTAENKKKREQEAAAKAAKADSLKAAAEQAAIQDSIKAAEKAAGKVK